MRILLLWFFLCLQVLFAQEVNEKGKRETIKGLEAYYRKDTIVLRKANKKLIKLYKNQRDSTLLAQYYQYKAKYHEVFYTQDSAYYYYSLSKELSKSLKDSLEVGKCLLHMGNLQREVKDYLGSELSSLEALEYLVPLSSYEYIEKAYINLGLASLELNESEKPYQYFKEARFYNSMVSHGKPYFIYNCIGLYFQKNSLDKTAVDFFSLGIEGLFSENYKDKNSKQRFNWQLGMYDVSVKDSEQYAILLNNLARSNFKLGRLEKVLEQLYEVERIHAANNNLFQLSKNQINIAEYFIYFEDFPSAKVYAKKALKYAIVSHNNKYWLEALKILSKLTAGRESHMYLKEYTTLNDSLIKKERELTNQFAKIKFDNTKKERENFILKRENENRKVEIIKQKQRNLVIALLGVISFSGLLISILFFRFNKKRLLLERALDSKKSKEQERSRISKELHDGVLGKLFGIRLGLGFLDIQSNQKEKEKYSEYLNELQEIEKEIREVSHKLTIDVEGGYFPELIENLIESKSKVGSFNYSIVIDSEINWSIITNEIKINIHRVIHELLNNIIKHAKADFVEIKIDQKNEWLIISLADNGIGFNEEKVIDGIGIKNIKSRITALNGSIEIQSYKGVKVIIEIPIKETT
ncbi:sensor histidine kinase [Tenacibaculum amylolyticum]|uniref:sensor histidine kinase n=1 Tax=Tenacibaculum amylolyticum TaxID=104269 RepID=UPI003894CEBE